MSVCQNTRCLEIHDLGLIEYRYAYALQKKHLDEILLTHNDVLLLCEHPAVLTLGRLARRENILVSQEEIARRNISIIETDRGGDVTLHAPGQLVVYPILDLQHHGRDLKKYISQLEQVAIDFLGRFDIVTGRFPCRTGVWKDLEKIVSIGIGVKKWISYHGLAVNLNTDLKLFSLIRPCGLDAAMTSVAQLLGRSVDMRAAKKLLIEDFCRHFDIAPLS